MDKVLLNLLRTLSCSSLPEAINLRAQRVLSGITSNNTAKDTRRLARWLRTQADTLDNLADQWQTESKP